MNEPDTQMNKLFQKAKDVSLLREEKEAIHGVLASFMESNPIVSADEKTKIATAQPSPLEKNVSPLDHRRRADGVFGGLNQAFFAGKESAAADADLSAIPEAKLRGIRTPVMNPRSTRLYKGSGNTLFALFNKQKKTRMIIALLVAFGLTAGTSFAAQSTLPGDTLYPVKIHLNEGVEALVAVGAKADAEVKAKHALTRLEEAGKLNAEGRLTAEHKGEVEQRFREHVKEMDEDLHELRARGDEETETRVRGEFKQKAEKHRKHLLVVSVDGYADVEHSIDLNDLLEEEDHDRSSDLDEGDDDDVMASTTLRINNEQEDAQDADEKDRDDRDDEEHDDVEVRGGIPLEVHTSAEKPDISSGIRSAVDLSN